jgi:hypothetical protein
MSITFIWSVMPDGLRVKEVSGNQDTVISVHFKITATDGTHAVDMQRVAELRPVPGAPFTPYSQLTEQQVINWAKAVMPVNNIDRIEELLAQRLEQKQNPPVRSVIKPAPWNTCSQG